MPDNQQPNAHIEALLTGAAQVLHKAGQVDARKVQISKTVRDINESIQIVAGRLEPIRVAVNKTTGLRATISKVLAEEKNDPRAGATYEAGHITLEIQRSAQGSHDGAGLGQPPVVNLKIEPDTTNAQIGRAVVIMTPEWNQPGSRNQEILDARLTKFFEQLGRFAPKSAQEFASHYQAALAQQVQQPDAGDSTVTAHRPVPQFVILTGDVEGPPFK